MTGRQCLEMVRRNRGLRVLRLGMVTGVDAEFVRDLADLGEDGDSRSLTVLELESCANLVLKDNKDLEWVEKMVQKGLQELCFKDCKGVNGELLARARPAERWEERGLKLVSPDDGNVETKSCDGDLGNELTEGKGAPNVLEVDPEYV